MTQQNSHKKDRNKPSIDLSAMVYGKIPPQARELEEAVIGAIMLERGAFDRASEILDADCFYVDAHQRIFKSFTRLVQQSKPIDLHTVAQTLLASGELEMIGGVYGLSKLTNSVVSSANIEAHSMIIKEKFTKREAIRLAGEVLNSAYDDSTDAFDLIDDLEAKVFAITSKTTQTNYISISASAAQVINHVDQLRNSDEELSGVPSGFPSLDRVTYGWQKTDLIILAARPAVGKTAFALNLARNAAMHPTKKTAVAFFSLEMNHMQLTQRVMAAESGVFLESINRARFNDPKYYDQLLSKGVGPMQHMPIFIDDSGSLNLFQFRSKARRLVNKNQVGFIIIDYLQLMNGTTKSGGNREQEISSLSRGLKQLAKELQVPIIALSQLSRAVETRKESKIPQLSDLRESGAIEQDADMVMFIYRPEYYEVMNDENGESTRGETHIRIAKHRNGSLETIKLRANLAIQKFTEWDGPENPSENLPNGGWKPLKSLGNSFDDGFNTDQPF